MSRILIVDDDKDIACLVSDALEDEGFKTKICNTGEEVLNFLEKKANEVSLITLDIMLMYGKEAQQTKLIQTAARAIPSKTNMKESLCRGQIVRASFIRHGLRII